MKRLARFSWGLSAWALGLVVGCGHNLDEQQATKSEGLSSSSFKSLGGFCNTVLTYPNNTAQYSKVLYLFHGSGGNASAVINQAGSFLDPFSAFRIVSISACSPGSWNTSSPWGSNSDLANISNVDTWLKANGYLNSSPLRRAVGISMGGNMASQVALTWPSNFNKIGCMSSPCKRIAGVNPAVTLLYAHGEQDNETPETTPAAIDARINSHYAIGGWVLHWHFAVGGHQWYPSVGSSWASYMSY